MPTHSFLRPRVGAVAAMLAAAGALLYGTPCPILPAGRAPLARADTPAAASGTPRTWPRLRGADGAGQGGTRRFPNSWGIADFAWSVDLPGAGHSSPVVWEGRVYTASALPDPADPARCTRTLSCHATADGALLWERRIEGPVEPFNAQNSLASSSPAADADGVYWLWATPDNLRVEAFDHAGLPRWHADLGPFATEHGFGTSPALVGDLLVVPMEQDGPSAVLALEAATGLVRWRLPRDTARTAYSPPLGIGAVGEGPEQIVLASMAHGLSGVEAATGRVLWESRCLPKRSVSCPVAVVAGTGERGPIVVGTCGDGGGDTTLVAVRVPPGTKAAADAPAMPEEVYRLDRSSAPYVPSPLPVGERLVLWGDRGVVTCVDAATGALQWRGRVGGNFSASPVALGGAVLNVSADGEVIVIGAGDAFEVLGRTALGEECRASPAVADGKVFVRTAGRLRALAPLPE